MRLICMRVKRRNKGRDRSIRRRRRRRQATVRYAPADDSLYLKWASAPSHTVCISIDRQSLRGAVRSSVADLLFDVVAAAVSSKSDVQVRRDWHRADRGRFQPLFGNSSSRRASSLAARRSADAQRGRVLIAP